MSRVNPAGGRGSHRPATSPSPSSRGLGLLMSRAGARKVSLPQQQSAAPLPRFFQELDFDSYEVVTLCMNACKSDQDELPQGKLGCNRFPAAAACAHHALQAEDITSSQQQQQQHQPPPHHPHVPPSPPTFMPLQTQHHIIPPIPTHMVPPPHTHTRVPPPPHTRMKRTPSPSASHRSSHLWPDDVEDLNIC